MIDDTIKAYCILGICETTSREIKLLLLDPHELKPVTQEDFVRECSSSQKSRKGNNGARWVTFTKTFGTHDRWLLYFPHPSFEDNNNDGEKNRD